MKASRISPGTRKAARWYSAAGAVRASSSNDANGKFADHLKILHGRLRNGSSAAVLEDLSRSLGRVTVSEHPRTFKLLQSGRRKLARKVIEEACEVTVEAVKRDVDGVVRESADVLYHFVVLWFQMGIEPNAVWREMQRRADTLAIAEKLPKASDPKSTSAEP